MAEPVTLLQATPGRVKVLREMEEHPYSVSDTVDYPESPMQTVMPPTEEAVGGAGTEYNGPWSLSNPRYEDGVLKVDVLTNYFMVNGYIRNWFSYSPALLTVSLEQEYLQPRYWVGIKAEICDAPDPAFELAISYNWWPFPSQTTTTDITGKAWAPLGEINGGGRGNLICTQYMQALPHLLIFGNAVM